MFTVTKIDLEPVVCSQCGLTWVGIHLCIPALQARIAQLEAELAAANRRIEAHGPICLKWQHTLHDADARIRELEAQLATAEFARDTLISGLEQQQRSQTEPFNKRIAKLEAALRGIAENEDCRAASCGVEARRVLGLALETPAQRNCEAK